MNYSISMKEKENDFGNRIFFHPLHLMIGRRTNPLCLLDCDPKIKMPIVKAHILTQKIFISQNFHIV